MAVLASPSAAPTNDMPPRRRRWIPLSVRIFGAVLLIVFVSGALWMGVRFYRQEQVLREIRQADGTVKFEYDGPDWLRKWLNDDWLAVFRRIDQVTLPFSETLDANTRHLVEMRPLPVLYIEDGPPVHDLIYDGRLEELHSVLAKHRILRFSRQQRYGETLLHMAVLEGKFEIQQRIDLVNFLLDEGLEVNPVPSDPSRSVLFSAREPAIVELLLDRGASVAAEGSNERTVLDHAANRFAESRGDDRNKWLEISRLLSAAGAECNLVSASLLNDCVRVQKLLKRAELKQIQEAFRAAANSGRTEIVKILLEHGADPHEIRSFRPIVFEVIRHPPVLQILFAKGVRLNATHARLERTGWTLLHEAAEDDAVESARLLIDLGISVDVQADDAMTPLHVAAQRGQVAVVKLLIEQHANIHAETSDRMTPIAYSVFKLNRSTSWKSIEQLQKWRETTELLLAAGAPQELSTAIALGRTAAVRQMLDENPALASSADRRGDLPLNWAVNLDQPEIVEILLAAGAKIDATGDDMDTPLHRAAQLGRLAIAKILIEHHADVNQADPHGRVPLHWSAYYFKPQLVRLLLEAGAKRDVTDRNGRTPLDRARNANDGRLVTKAEDEDEAETIRLLSEP